MLLMIGATLIILNETSLFDLPRNTRRVPNRNGKCRPGSNGTRYRQLVSEQATQRPRDREPMSSHQLVSRTVIRLLEGFEDRL